MSEDGFGARGELAVRGEAMKVCYQRARVRQGAGATRGGE